MIPSYKKMIKHSMNVHKRYSGAMFLKKVCYTDEETIQKLDIILKVYVKKWTMPIEDSVLSIISKGMRI